MQSARPITSLFQKRVIFMISRNKKQRDFVTHAGLKPLLKGTRPVYRYIVHGYRIWVLIK